MRFLELQRTEKAILGALEAFEGVPLTVLDIADEAGYSEGYTRLMLNRFYRRYIVQGQKRYKPEGGMAIWVFWVGMPKI